MAPAGGLHSTAADLLLGLDPASGTAVALLANAAHDPLLDGTGLRLLDELAEATHCDRHGPVRSRA